MANKIQRNDRTDNSICMTTTIEIPIYDIDVIVIIDSNWVDVNEKFELDLSENDLKAEAWTICDEGRFNEIYVLFKPETIDNETLLHELFHIISRICEARDIVMDHKNDEPLAYLQGYIGQRVFEIRDQFLKF